MFSDLSAKLNVSIFKILEVDEYSAGISITSDETEVASLEPVVFSGNILSIKTPFL